MDMDTLDGDTAGVDAASSTNSLWGNLAGMGHAVAGAWDVMNGSYNYALSAGLRAIGDEEDAAMSDRFMEQRWQSATDHFQQMHRDFDGTGAAAANSLDAQGTDGQDGWAADGTESDDISDSSFGDDEQDGSGDEEQDDSGEDASDDTGGDADDSPDADFGEDTSDSGDADS